MTISQQTSVTRRDAVRGAAAGAAAVGLGVISKQAQAQEAFDAIVIGTGFGGGVATLALSAHGQKTLVIERGTFWVTPETLGAPTAPTNAVIDFANRNKMRVQFWSRPDHALGLLDLLANRYHDANPYGLHNYRMFRHAHILTASGVGGGSLIYSNVNLQARPAVLDRIGLKGIDYDRTQVSRQVQQSGHQDPPSGRRDPRPTQQEGEQGLSAARPQPRAARRLRSRGQADRRGHAVESARPVDHRVYGRRQCDDRSSRWVRHRPHLLRAP